MSRIASARSQPKQSFRRRLSHFLMATGAVLTAGGGGGSAQAANFSTWNIQVLYGEAYADDFGIDDKEKVVVTLEHFDDWKYGDNFAFVDINNPTEPGTSHYAEFSPRLSLGKITGKPIKLGPIKDVLLAGTLEMGDGVRAYLIGPGVALDLPGFAFADVNFYYRESERDFVAVQTDSGYQVTVDWLSPFKLGEADFTFGGFIDYAWSEEGGTAPKADNAVSGIQLLYDVGKPLGAKPGTLGFGVEYGYWKNKFGIDGVDESNVNIMVKWTP